jgi:hypothetical protein
VSILEIDKQEGRKWKKFEAAPPEVCENVLEKTDLVYFF